MITTKELKIVAGLEVLPCARGRGGIKFSSAFCGRGASVCAWAWGPEIISERRIKRCFRVRVGVGLQRDNLTVDLRCFRVRVGVGTRPTAERTRHPAVPRVRGRGCPL